MQFKRLSLSMITVLMLSGCGGEGEDQYTTSPGDAVEQNTLGWKKSKDTVGNTEDLVNDITRIVLTNTVGLPLIDTLILNAHDVVMDDAVCDLGGSFSYSNHVIQLNNCGGLFFDYIANGRIDVSSKADTFTFRNVELKTANNELVLVNGTVKVSMGSDAATFTTDQLYLDAKELIDTATFDIVEYKVTAYSSTWKSLNARESSISNKGRVQSTGNNEGDFNVSFDSTKTPFIYDISGDAYYPFTGGLSVQDRSNSKNFIAIVANRDENSFQYKVTENNKVLINKNVLWQTAFDY